MTVAGLPRVATTLKSVVFIGSMARVAKVLAAASNHASQAACVMTPRAMAAKAIRLSPPSNVLVLVGIGGTSAMAQHTEAVQVRQHPVQND